MASVRWTTNRPFDGLGDDVRGNLVRGLRDIGARRKKIKFDRVLLVGEAGDDATIGTPYVSGAAVTAEVLEEVKGDKIDVIKFKRRKGYRRKVGHTQRFLRVRIEEITGPASKSKPRTTK